MTTTHADADIDDLKRRVQSLENKVLIAVTVAAVLGLSIVGLSGWLKVAETRVSNLNQQVTEAKAIIKTTSDQQIALIQTKAGPIVDTLAQQKLGPIPHQIHDLQDEAYFILFATICYPGHPGGRYHDRLSDRKGVIATEAGRSQTEIERDIMNEGYACEGN